MEEKKETLSQRQEDMKEFAQLLKGLSHEEKREIRGILIGMQLKRDQMEMKAETTKTA